MYANYGEVCKAVEIQTIKLTIGFFLFFYEQTGQGGPGRKK